LIIDVPSAGRELVRGLSAAHDSIVKSSNHYSECGSTSLLAGILMETEYDKVKSPRSKGKRKTRFFFLTLSVGDCMAFHWSSQVRNVKEITNRPVDSSSCGKLGPQIFRDCPDLRNIDYCHCYCSDDDLIFIVTNGIYDNFDPEHLGLNPRDVSMYQQSLSPSSSQFELPLKWHDMDPIARQALKSKFMVEMMTKLLNDSPSPLTPKTIVSTLCDFCVQVTQSKRDFIDTNPQKKPPNSSLYPGVFDQSTCICFEVKRSLN